MCNYMVLGFVGLNGFCYEVHVSHFFDVGLARITLPCTVYRTTYAKLWCRRAIVTDQCKPTETGEVS